jgi:hypothetical protein
VSGFDVLEKLILLILGTWLKICEWKMVISGDGFLVEGNDECGLVSVWFCCRKVSSCGWLDSDWGCDWECDWECDGELVW